MGANYNDAGRRTKMATDMQQSADGKSNYGERMIKAADAYEPHTVYFQQALKNDPKLAAAFDQMLKNEYEHTP